VSSTATEGAAEYGRALAAIPSPSINSIPIGPLEIHFYALCILAGTIVAVFWSERRWTRMGGESGTIMDMAVWAVILGLIGARLYHVISDAQLYFGPGREPIRALYIWEGGLGIWGAIPMGAVGVWLVARKRGLSLSKLSFAIAPTIPLAQGLGRWGNYFNQELFGAPTDLPWALRIDPSPEGGLRQGMIPGESLYHPTFLYEFLWCVGLTVVLVLLGRRYEEQLAGGRLFAVYVMGYCAGRFWIEYLRIDPANDFFGMRLNNWTSIVVFLGALAYFVWAGRRLDRFSTAVVPHGHDAGTQVFGATPGGEVADDSTVYSAVDPEDSEIGSRNGSSEGAGTEYHPSPERSSTESSTASPSEDTGTDSGTKPE
jgi:prolipoprotein diacylglyceryl transferase